MCTWHCGKIGTLSKLTRRPRGGGVNKQISIQKDSRPSEFCRPLTSSTLWLNGDLNVTASSWPPRQFAKVLNMWENAAGKCTGKEISLFCAESAKVVSSTDYHAWLKLKRMWVVGFKKKSTCILLKNISSWYGVILAWTIDISGNRYGSVYGRRMARLCSEILGLSYQGDAGQVFHIVCFRCYQRTAHDFRGSVF